MKHDLDPAKAKAANRPDPATVFHWPADWEVYGYDVEKVTPIGAVVMAGEHRGKVKVAEGVFMNGVPAQKPQGN